jgi:hypothetical protein
MLAHACRPRDTLGFGTRGLKAVPTQGAHVSVCCQVNGPVGILRMSRTVLQTKMLRLGSAAKNWRDLIAPIHLQCGEVWRGLTPRLIVAMLVFKSMLAL